jgi:hypothetical protein
VSTTVNSVPVALAVLSLVPAQHREKVIKHTRPADGESLPVEGLDPSIHRRKKWRRRVVLEGHVRRPRNEVSGHRCAALEVLDRDALSVERRSLVVRKRAGLLGEGRSPVGLRRLLDGRPIPLPVGADPEDDAVAVEGGLVREGSSCSSGTGRSGIRGPPRVGRELQPRSVRISVEKER